MKPKIIVLSSNGNVTTLFRFFLREIGFINRVVYVTKQEDAIAFLGAEAGRQMLYIAEYVFLGEGEQDAQRTAFVHAAKKQNPQLKVGVLDATEQIAQSEEFDVHQDCHRTRDFICTHMS